MVAKTTTTKQQQPTPAAPAKRTDKAKEMPRLASMPPFPVRSGGVGRILHFYIEELRKKKLEREAQVVETILAEMVAANYASVDNIKPLPEPKPAKAAAAPAKPAATATKAAPPAPAPISAAKAGVRARKEKAPTPPPAVTPTPAPEATPAPAPDSEAVAS